MTAQTFSDRLVDKGASLRIGPLTINMRIADRSVAGEVAAVYGRYPTGPREGLADLDIGLRPPGNLRAFHRPQITVHLNGTPVFEPMPRALGAVTLESAINWCVATHILRYLILHAAVVEKQGCAVVLPGRSGAGKSTLCAALIADGWRLLSDEFALVRPADGLIVAHPRPVSLKNRSIDIMAERFPAASFTRRYPNTNKGTMALLHAPAEAIRKAEDPARPILIVAPRYEAGAPLSLQPLERADTFMRLVDQSANYFTLMQRGFETLAALIERCTLYGLTYSDLDQATATIGRLAGDGRTGSRAA